MTSMNDPDVNSLPNTVPGWQQPAPTNDDGKWRDAWVVVRHGQFIISLTQPLPPRWSDFLMDFRKQMRPIPVPTRRELVRHVWRQFIGLPMVDVRLVRPHPPRFPFSRLGLDPEFHGSHNQRRLERTGDPSVLTDTLESMSPDDMYGVLQSVAKAVRRHVKWPLLNGIQQGRGIDV
jgi:hypothetical protein